MLISSIIVLFQDIEFDIYKKKLIIAIVTFLSKLFR